MKRLATVFILTILLLPVYGTAATYNSATNAYERSHYKIALKEFRQLARTNDPYAQYMLGQMFLHGEGTKKNMVKAYKWLLLAEENDMEQAKRLRKRIGRQMSSTQKRQAAKLAAQWNHKYGYQPQAINNQSTIRQVQKKLKSLGYYPYTIDGTMGHNTRNGISSYQRHNRLYVDGKITPRLLAHLGISDNNQQNDNSLEARQIKKELKKIIRKAKRRNDAKPWVIQRLEELASDHHTSYSFSNPVMIEDFRKYYDISQLDWKINSGRLHMDSSLGLVARPVNGWNYTSNNSENLGAVLLDTLIQHAAGQNSQSRLVKLQKNLNFGNSFSLKVETSLLENTEGFIIACNSDRQNYSGYRLIVTPGYGKDEIKLLKIGKSTTEELYHFTDDLKLDGRGNQKFQWNRTARGEMTIHLNNQQLFSVNDTSIQAPFQQLSLAHIGRQVAIKAIQLHDTNQQTVLL